MLVVTGTVTASAETIDEARAASLEHVRRSRTEPGCLSHDVAADCEDPLRLIFVERWSGRDALETHFRHPGSLAFIATLRRLRVRSTGPEIFEVREP